MKHVILTSLLLLALSLCGCSSDVYICTGPMSGAYHSTDECEGLSRCSGDVVAVSKAEAKEMGRHACHFCH